jgi:hypothetical protein
VSATFNAIRRACAARAEGSCEACGVWVGLQAEEGHADHFSGRGAGRPEAAVSNVWILCPPCDVAKTESKPNAAHWLQKFIKHAEKHGYAAEAERAGARLLVLKAKGRA